MHVKTVANHLVSFFTHFGMPREVQSDRGVNFTSILLKQTMKNFDITHVVSSVYHPQSQGTLERHHQTFLEVDVEEVLLGA